MIMVKDIERRAKPFICRSTRAELTVTGCSGVGEISTSSGNIVCHKRPTCLSGGRLQCDELRLRALDELAADGWEEISVEGATEMRASLPWPTIASIRYVNGER
jgi:hypothetical protein